MDITRSLLLFDSIPRQFKTDVVFIVVYLINTIPSFILSRASPREHLILCLPPMAIFMYLVALVSLCFLLASGSNYVLVLLYVFSLVIVQNIRVIVVMIQLLIVFTSLVMLSSLSTSPTMISLILVMFLLLQLWLISLFLTYVLLLPPCPHRALLPLCSSLLSRIPLMSYLLIHSLTKFIFVKDVSMPLLILMSPTPSLAPPVAPLDNNHAFVERCYPIHMYRPPQFYSYASTTIFSPAFCAFMDTIHSHQ